MAPRAPVLRSVVAGLAFLLFAGWLPAESRAAVVRQPYLQQVTPNSMTIVWRTNTAPSGNSLVEYGETLGSYPQSATAAPVVPDATFVSGVWDHIVTVSGLTPGRKYYYRVGTTGGGSEAGGSAEHFFVTAPPVGSKTPFSAWVIGDSGNASTAQRDVRDAMLAYTSSDPPDLFLHVGDIAYDNGTDSDWTNNHFAQYQTIQRNTPFWPAIGNHDSYVPGFDPGNGTGKGPYFDAHVLPTNAEAGGVASGTESYYSFDYANVHFVVLNSHDTNAARRTNMLSWLTADLQSTDQDWVVAFWHHPPYSKGSHDSDSEEQLIWTRENALPILEANGVDLVLTGHSHNYERSCLIDSAYATPTPSFSTLIANGNILDEGDGDPAGDGAYVKAPALNDGAVHIVTGHGGRSIGGTGTHPVMCNVLGDDEAAEYGSTLIRFEGNTLTMEGLLRTGAINDTFAIVKADWVAYNDLNDGVGIAGGAAADNPDNGDGNAPGVTGHDYYAVDAPLTNFFTGDPLEVSITGRTGTTPAGDRTGCTDAEGDCYDPTNNDDTGAMGAIDAGTDADRTFDGNLDFQGVHELDEADWDNVIEFDNLDPSKTYSIATTANRNNASYAGARFSRVTILGADSYTNASTPGVTVHSSSSVSFSTGYNEEAGNVARWIDVSPGADGSFSILTEWNDALGSGPSNDKAYAMSVFELMQFSSAGALEDFEDGFPLGQPVGDGSGWFDGGNGPVVTAGIGVGGSVGLAPGTAVFTWTDQPFDWNAASFSGFRATMDFETDGSGGYDDDRLGFTISDVSVDSSNVFAVQLDPGGGGPSGMNIEGYWDGLTADDERRPSIVDLPALDPNTFYRLEVEITKLRDAADPLGPAARVDVRLWSLDTSGNPLAVVASGGIADTSALDADAPNAKYFTGPIWPAFKNFTGASGAADNASIYFITGGAPSICTADVDCSDGLFCNGAETCDVGTGVCIGGSDPCVAGTTCGETSDLCLAPGDVIISGFQSWNDVSGPPSPQSPGEFVELFNTTDQTISLEDMNLVSRVDVDPGDGSVEEDWNLRSDASPNLSGLSIAPESFVLIAESGVIGDGGVVDLTTDMNLATGEGGIDERAISLELTVDGVHMDYVLYGRQDGSDPAGQLPPGDIPFDPTMSGATLIHAAGLPVLPAGSEWRHLDDGSDQGSAWRAPAFDDGSWASGPAPLGYGGNGEVTTVSFGQNESDKHITTYFRRDFSIIEASKIGKLSLELLRDDGAVVYLNGTEVARSNLPAAPALIESETLANSAVGGADETTFLSFDVDPLLLVDGINTLAVEVHQAAADSSDLGFDLALYASSDWSFLDDGADAGTAWREPGFDDSSWSVGPARLGYGDDGEATTVSFGLDENDKHITTYFRTVFDVANAASVGDLVLQLLRDDGAVVYLNGTEVARSNLPDAPAPIGSETLASSGVGNADELAYFQFSVDPGVLVDGPNILAVEIHQIDATSSDLGLDLSLVAPTQRTEIIRNTRATDSFQEGVVRRLGRDALHAGFDVPGFYTDEDALGDGFPNGVWQSPHLQTDSDYVARSSYSLPVPEFCTSDGDCDDTNACNGVETCELGSGLCLAGAPVVCQIGEVCNPGDGVCEAAPTLTSFQDGVGGYAGTRDSFLQENAPSAVNGTLALWEWDDDDPNGSGQQNFGLIQFDAIFGNGPGQIPVGSMIEFATLHYTLQDPGVDATVHEMLVPWSEASSLSSLCTGGSCDAGAEYVAAAVGTATGSPVGAQSVDVTSSLQAWAAAPGSNRGWILLPPGSPGATGGGAEVSARESGTSADRPWLEVSYLPPTCASDTDCDDGNGCTDDACNLVSELCEFTPNTLACDDGIACTLNDQCGGGSCQPGSPDDSLCDDANVCTDDACNAFLGCEFADNTAPCSDGLSCTIGDVCGAGVCGGSDDCPVGDVCDPDLDVCIAGPVTLEFRQGQDGYRGTVDTFLQEDPSVADADNSALAALGWDSDDPSGSGNDVATLIRFAGVFGSAQTQVPVGAVIDEALLTYTVGADAGGPEGDTGGLHQVLIPWAESVSWNAFGGDPGPSVGDEFDPAIVASLPAATADTFSVDVTASLQAWANDPADNLGWIAIPTGTDGVDLRSSEYSAAAERPSLTVTFRSGPACVTDAECNDDLRCTSDSCVSGVCDNADSCATGEFCDVVDDLCRQTPVRVEDGLLVLYTFDEDTGDIVEDVSGNGEPLDLMIGDPGAVAWLPDGSLDVFSPAVISSPGAASKLTNAILASGEVTVEAWISPADAGQFGPARIVALSANAFPDGSNFMLGQSTDRFEMRFRTTATNQYGNDPALDGPPTLGPALTHVVFTRDATGATTLYVDGSPVANGNPGVSLASWDPTHPLTLANEPQGNRSWLGRLFLVAFYDRDLSPSEVAQNFDAGENAGAAGPCTQDSDCDDGVSCTDDSCVAGSCDFTPNCAAGETCDLFAGVCVQPPDRISDGLVVLYTFEEGEGATVGDASQNGTPMDLTIADPASVSWLPDGSLDITSPAVISSTGAASKVTDAVLASGEVTVEAWITPLDTTQFGPARIVALSENAFPDGSNFVLGQSTDSVSMRFRTTDTNQYGNNPSLDGPPTLDTTLTHVVFTRDVSGATSLFMDGVLVETGNPGSSLASWDPSQPLTLANEPQGDRSWLGRLHLVAIYDRDLGPAEVSQNLDAGVHFVPEPTGTLMLLTGIGFLGLLQRRRNR